MKIVKKAVKWIFYLLLIPITYLLISLVLTAITVDRKDTETSLSKSIFLSTNGIHLDIILPTKNTDSSLVSGIDHTQTVNYLAFGWGDENFYLNTPTWGDLTFKNGFGALFLKSSTLVHVTRYQNKRSDWIEIKVTEKELKKINHYLNETFFTNENGEKILLKDQGYTATDDFYKANGSYTCFNTCNSWVNAGFKKSGLKSCYWTPFDFGLMNKYK